MRSPVPAKCFLTSSLVVLVVCSAGLGRAAGVPAEGNLAREASISTDQVHSREFRAEYAIDGALYDHGGRDTNQAWATDCEKFGTQAQLTLEWPKPVTIGRLLIKGRTYYRASHWKGLKVRAEGKNEPAWEGELANNSGPHSIPIVPAVTTRKLVLEFVSAHGTAGPGIAELGVYGPQSAGVDSGTGSRSGAGAERPRTDRSAETTPKADTTSTPGDTFHYKDRKRNYEYSFAPGEEMIVLSSRLPVRTERGNRGTMTKILYHDDRVKAHELADAFVRISYEEDGEQVYGWVLAEWLKPATMTTTPLHEETGWVQFKYNLLYFLVLAAIVAFFVTGLWRIPYAIFLAPRCACGQPIIGGKGMCPSCGRVRQ